MITAFEFLIILFCMIYGAIFILGYFFVELPKKRQVEKAKEMALETALEELGKMKDE